MKIDCSLHPTVDHRPLLDEATALTPRTLQTLATHQADMTATRMNYWYRFRRFLTPCS